MCNNSFPRNIKFGEKNLTKKVDRRSPRKTEITATVGTSIDKIRAPGIQFHACTRDKNKQLIAEGNRGHTCTFAIY